MREKQRMDPKKQFSKWLARYGAIVWCVYVFAVLAVVAYRPEAAMPCVWLTLIMTANKALDTLSYTQNSTTEKIMLAMLDKTSMELKLGGMAKGGGPVAEETDGEPEEVSNG